MAQVQLRNKEGGTQHLKKIEDQRNNEKKYGMQCSEFCT